MRHSTRPPRNGTTTSRLTPLSEADRAAIEAEIADLDNFAASRHFDRPQRQRQSAAEGARASPFDKAAELGAARRRRSSSPSPDGRRDYLLRVLATARWQDGIVLFNGSNTDERSQAIYAAWLEQHQGTDRITRLAHRRHALCAGGLFPRAGPDHDRHRGRRRGHQPAVLLARGELRPAVESAADRAAHRPLPSLRPEARRRRRQLPQPQERGRPARLRTAVRKVQLFEGVFGASDEVLGAIESGVDFEKRINDIYQRCRKTDEIKTAFDQLQLELSFEINEAMTQTQRKLLENFDDDVRDKLRVRDAAARDSWIDTNRC